jgi:hypothetical protein
MQSATNGLPTGLRFTFLLGAIGGLAFAVSSMAVPDVIANLSGLPGKDLPVYQQAGGAVLGYTVGAFLMWRAANWEQIRIALLAALTFTALSALGAIYYVVLKGVVTGALVVVMLYSIFLTVAYGYYWLKQSSQGVRQ